MAEPFLDDLPEAPPVRQGQPAPPPPGPSTPAAQRDLLEQARKQFRLVSDSEGPLRRRQLEDQRFCASEQWDPELKRQREADRRPCLTINRIRGGVKAIANDQRNNPPSVQVNPVDDDADVATAEVLQGIIRNIETSSDAPIAYQTAGENAATIGQGFLWLYSQYADDTGQSFQQEVRIARILNRFTVYLDPSAIEFDKCDMRFAFITADFPPDVFHDRWPRAKAVAGSAALFASIGDTVTDWFPENQIRVAQYYYVEDTEQTFGLVNGQSLPKAQWPEGITPDRTRTVRTRVVRWVLMTAVDILEQTIVPGTRIPLIPVIGDESLDDLGRVDYRGIVRDAKEPQKIDNAMESATVEQIGLGPRAPYVMAEGQDEGYEDLWKTANSRNWARLIYKPTSVEGQVLPPPQRNAIEPPIQATVVAAQRAENNLRAVMGFMDVHGAEQAPAQQSGRAILARQAQAQQGNVNYNDNLSRAIRSLGRLLIEWIPIIYELPQVIRIAGLDEQQKKVMVYSGQQNAPDFMGLGQDAWLAARGLQGLYDLGLGKYDVTVTSGPSYQSRRQEAAAAMVEYVRAYPPAFPIVGDLLTKNMDWPGAHEISARLKKMLPPQLQDQPPGGGPPLPPQAQAMMSQAQQHIAMLTQQNAQLQQEAQGRLIEASSKERMAAADRESRERIAALNAQVMLLQTEAKLRADKFQTLFEQEMANLRDLTQQQHEGVGQLLDLMGSGNGGTGGGPPTPDGNGDAGAFPGAPPPGPMGGPPPLPAGGGPHLRPPRHVVPHLSAAPPPIHPHSVGPPTAPLPGAPAGPGGPMPLPGGPPGPVPGG